MKKICLVAIFGLIALVGASAQVKGHSGTAVPREGPVSSEPAPGDTHSNAPVSPLQTKKTIILIPEGAFVEIPPDAPEYGLVQATWDGKSIEVFAEDVRERGCQVKTAHP